MGGDNDVGVGGDVEVVVAESSIHKIVIKPAAKEEQKRRMQEIDELRRTDETITKFVLLRTMRGDRYRGTMYCA